MRALLITLVGLLLVPGMASAVSIDWVTVGDPGNACDPQSDGCYGAVPYTYQISKYEVTHAQYAEFLNAVAATDTYGLYNLLWDHGSGGIAQSGSSGSYTYSTIAGREDMPVTRVSFYDALRFANWLHNGQPTGAQDSTTTEDGAYTMITEGYPSGPFITRNAGATVVLSGEDEWYKAAYYDAASMSYNPYAFADGFNGAACESPPGTTSHSANCNEPSLAGDLTDVGHYTGSPSPNGTFDQSGNVWEWNETIIGSLRGLRGGSFINPPPKLAASYRHESPLTVYTTVGFRVARPPAPASIPTLSQWGLITFGMLLLTAMAVALRRQRTA